MKLYTRFAGLVKNKGQNKGQNKGVNKGVKSGGKVSNGRIGL